MIRYPGRIDYQTVLSFFQANPTGHYYVTPNTYIEMEVRIWFEKRVKCRRIMFRLINKRTRKTEIATSSQLDQRYSESMCMRSALGLISDDHTPIAERQRAA